MRKYLLLFLITTSSIGYGQDARFGIRSIEQNMGVSSTFSNYYDFGLSIGSDITAEYDRHLWAIRFDFAGQFEFLSYAVNQYFKLNLMYGREFSVSNWLVLDGLLGLGYLNFRKENYDTGWTTQINRAINLPMALKVLFVCGKVLRLGINPNIDINTFKTIYSSNLVLQFKFR